MPFGHSASVAGLRSTAPAPGVLRQPRNEPGRTAKSRRSTRALRARDERAGTGRASGGSRDRAREEPTRERARASEDGALRRRNDLRLGQPGATSVSPVRRRTELGHQCRGRARTEPVSRHVPGVRRVTSNVEPTSNARRFRCSRQQEAQPRDPARRRRSRTSTSRCGTDLRASRAASRGGARCARRCVASSSASRVGTEQRGADMRSLAMPAELFRARADRETATSRSLTAIEPSRRRGRRRLRRAKVDPHSAGRRARDSTLPSPRAAVRRPRPRSRPARCSADLEDLALRSRGGCARARASSDRGHARTTSSRSGGARSGKQAQPPGRTRAVGTAEPCAASKDPSPRATVPAMQRVLWVRCRQS